MTKEWMVTDIDTGMPVMIKKSIKKSDNTKVMITDPDTGAKKENRLARFDLLPAHPLWQLAEHYGKGARKYADRNWEGGYDWSLGYSGLCRHLNLFWQGEDIDEETGTLHIIAVAWHALALAEFYETHPEKDNRPDGHTCRDCQET